MRNASQDFLVGGEIINRSDDISLCWSHILCGGMPAGVALDWLMERDYERTEAFTLLVEVAADALEKSRPSDGDGKKLLDYFRACEWDWCLCDINGPAENVPSLRATYRLDHAVHTNWMEWADKAEVAVRKCMELEDALVT